MSADALAKVIDFTAEQIIAAAKLDGLPLDGKLWTLTVTDGDVLLRISAGLNGSPRPRQPPPPPPKPQPKTPPPPPTKPGGK